jgi:hypothetical protein
MSELSHIMSDTQGINFYTVDPIRPQVAAAVLTLIQYNTISLTRQQGVSNLQAGASF